jgi:nucleotide-binding universal stress UspA family protein
MDPAGVPSAATRYRPVVLGVDIDNVDSSVIEFAFDEAARRGTALRAVHAWYLPSYYADGSSADLERYDEVGRWHASALTEALSLWREKYPHVEMAEECREGSPADHLVDASRQASLVVVGRRIRHHRFGRHIGPVTQPVLHRATTPVAVVAHA